MSYFYDRQDAGLKLATMLTSYKNANDTIILALPRGGVPVAAIMASKLNLPLDILLVRKLGHPDHQEFAFGAISVGNVIIINPPYTYEDIIKKTAFKTVLKNERNELKRRNHYYRQDKGWQFLNNKSVIIVDDGIATGATMKAAIKAVKEFNCKKIIVAVPVMPADEFRIFKNLVDKLYACHTPRDFRAVGLWYQNFNQVSDEEVISLYRG